MELGNDTAETSGELALRGDINAPLMCTLSLANTNDQNDELSGFGKSISDWEEQEIADVKQVEVPVQERATEAPAEFENSEKESEISSEVLPDYTMPDGKLVGLYRVVFSDFSSLHLSKGRVTVEQFKLGAIRRYNLSTKTNAGQNGLVSSLEHCVMWQLASILDIPGRQDYRCLIDLSEGEVTEAELRNEYLCWCGMPTLKLLTCNSVQQLKTSDLQKKFVELKLTECSTVLDPYIQKLESTLSHIPESIDDPPAICVNPCVNHIVDHISPSSPTADIQSGGTQDNSCISNVVSHCLEELTSTQDVNVQRPCHGNPVADDSSTNVDNITGDMPEAYACNGALPSQFTIANCNRPTIFVNSTLTVNNNYFLQRTRPQRTMAAHVGTSSSL